jgi:preprotein translocase subunit SecB
MKKPESIDLKEHLFEKLEIKLPNFPGKRSFKLVVEISGKHIVYFHRKDPTKPALRLIIEIRPRKTKPSNMQFKVLVSIIGIFEISPMNNKRKITKFIIDNGSPLLYEIVKSTLDRILFRSLIKPNQLPSINFRKLKKTRLAK